MWGTIPTALGLASCRLVTSLCIVTNLGCCLFLFLCLFIVVFIIFLLLLFIIIIFL